MQATALYELIDTYRRAPGGFFTFLEAHEVVRTASELRYVPTRALGAVALCFDLPHVTLGAQRLLREHFARISERIRDEWSLGQTAVGRDGNGRRVRIPVGGRLAVSLPEEPAAGATWEVRELRGPVALDFTRHYPPAEGGTTGYLRLELHGERLGLATLDLVSAGGAGRAGERRFALEIVVDERDDRLDLGVSGP